LLARVATVTRVDTPASTTSQLFHSEDCTNFFAGEYDPVDPNGGAAVDAYVDRIAAGGVTAFLCNTSAERTTYASAVWEPFWNGYDPDGADDQRYLSGIGEPGSAGVKSRRRLLDGTGIMLLGGLEVLIRPYRAADQRGVAPEEAIGVAAQIVHDGADGVYLFNYFPDGSATGNASGWWQRVEQPEKGASQIIWGTRPPEFLSLPTFCGWHLCRHLCRSDL
jgi:hypothetical protein